MVRLSIIWMDTTTSSRTSVRIAQKVSTDRAPSRSIYKRITVKRVCIQTSKSPKKNNDLILYIIRLQLICARNAARRSTIAAICDNMWYDTVAKSHSHATNVQVVSNVGRDFDRIWPATVDWSRTYAICVGRRSPKHRHWSNIIAYTPAIGRIPANCATCDLRAQTTWKGTKERTPAKNVSFIDDSFHDIHSKKFFSSLNRLFRSFKQHTNVNIVIERLLKATI